MVFVDDKVIKGNLENIFWKILDKYERIYCNMKQILT